jgi:gas vesicle protein
LTLTAFVGALVALLPRPEKPTQIAVVDEIDRLTQENKQLARSRRQLFEHIHMLEREILTEQHLCTHWRETAQRLAQQSRENREAAEKAGDALADYTRRRELRLSQEAQAQANMQAAMQAQHYAAMVPSDLGWAQLGMQNAAQPAQYAGLQNAFGGFCNCVPSRAQVWAADRGE